MDTDLPPNYTQQLLLLCFPGAEAYGSANSSPGSTGYTRRFQSILLVSFFEKVCLFRADRFKGTWTEGNNGLSFLYYEPS